VESVTERTLYTILYRQSFEAEFRDHAARN
jgi:hypothetical protein